MTSMRSSASSAKSSASRGGLWPKPRRSTTSSCHRDANARCSLHIMRPGEITPCTSTTRSPAPTASTCTATALPQPIANCESRKGPRGGAQCPGWLVPVTGGALRRWHWQTPIATRLEADMSPAQCALAEHPAGCVAGHRHQRVSTVPGPAQGTHRVAVRIASSRSRGMKPPQSSHEPDKPASSRSRARAARLSMSSACRAAPLAAQPLLMACPRSEFASRSTSAVRRACTQLLSTSASSAEGTSSSGGFIESKVVPPVGRAGCTPAPSTPDDAGRGRHQRRVRPSLTGLPQMMGRRLS
jgi:hypothetical protein